MIDFLREACFWIGAAVAVCIVAVEVLLILGSIVAIVWICFDEWKFQRAKKKLRERMKQP